MDTYEPLLNKDSPCNDEKIKLLDEVAERFYSCPSDSIVNVLSRINLMYSRLIRLSLVSKGTTISGYQQLDSLKTMGISIRSFYAYKPLNKLLRYLFGMGIIMIFSKKMWQSLAEEKKSEIKEFLVSLMKNESNSLQGNQIYLSRKINVILVEVR